MKTRTSFSIISTTALFVSVLAAESIYSSGDTSIHFVGGLSAISEDNVYLQSQNEVSDWRFEFDAGVEFSLNPDGAADTTLLVSNRWVNYSSEPLDDDFLKIRFNNTYDSGLILTNLYANYEEDYSSRSDLDSSNDVFGVILPRDKTEAGANLRYGLSQLTSMKVGIDYYDVDYGSFVIGNQTVSPFTGYDSMSIPVTLFYNIRPKVDLTAGVRYRQTDTDTSIEYTDMYYYVGAIGEVFSPVVHADLSVGWQDRNADGNNADASSASYKFSLIYTGDPKRKVYATVARDYRTSAVGSSTYAFTSASVGAQYSVSNTVGLNAALVYGESEYEESTRAEDIQMARLGVSYTPNDFLRLDAIYYYRDVDGNFADYTNNELRVTASLRY